MLAKIVAKPRRRAATVRLRAGSGRQGSGLATPLTAGEPFAIQQGARSIEVTISVGIAALGGSDDAGSVMKRADQALYRAKRDGRNRVVPDAA